MRGARVKYKVGFVLLGVGAFMLKRSYSGPLAQVIHGYAGNFAVSFAVYFLSAIAAARLGLASAPAALFALLAVETFEITNGFGVMSNVYDPIDLLVNAAGIAVGLVVNHAVDRHAPRSAERSAEG